MKIKLYKSVFISFVVNVIALSWGNLFADVSTITDISVVGESRGLMLIVSADSRLQGSLPQPVPKEFSTLTITIDQAENGLGYSEFDVEDSQLSGLVVKETGKADQVSLELKFRGQVKGPASIKTLDERMLVLLTKEPQAGLHWEAGAQTRRKTADAVVEKPAEKKAEQKTEKVDSPEDGKKPELQLEVAPEVKPPVETTQVQEQQTQTAMVRYNVYGRDPFVPIVLDTTQTSELPRAQSLRLVGVLEDDYERIALLENYRNYNRAYALRENDPVDNGKVLRIYRDKIVFLIRDYDVSRSYTLNLTKSDSKK